MNINTLCLLALFLASTSYAGQMQTSECQGSISTVEVEGEGSHQNLLVATDKVLGFDRRCTCRVYFGRDAQNKAAQYAAMLASGKFDLLCKGGESRKLFDEVITAIDLSREDGQIKFSMSKN